MSLKASSRIGLRRGVGDPLADAVGDAEHPSVTRNDGMATKATRAPLIAPTSNPVRSPASDAGGQAARVERHRAW